MLAASYYICEVIVDNSAFYGFFAQNCVGYPQKVVHKCLFKFLKNQYMQKSYQQVINICPKLY